MQQLVALSLEAYGGFDRWHQLRQISATFAPGGGILSGAMHQG